MSEMELNFETLHNEIVAVRDRGNECMTFCITARPDLISHTNDLLNEFVARFHYSDSTNGRQDIDRVTAQQILSAVIGVAE